MTSPPSTGADLMDEQGLSAANRKLEIVQNFSAHPGDHPEDRSDDAKDAPSYRQGWLDAIHALLDRVNTPDTRSPPPGDVREEVARLVREAMQRSGPVHLESAEDMTAEENAAQFVGYLNAREFDALPDAILTLSASPIQGWRPEDIELMRDAIEDCRPWGDKFSYERTRDMIDALPSTTKPAARRAYHDRNDQVERILSMLPAPPVPTEALGSVTPSASPSVVSRVSESGPATPSEDRS